MAYTKRTWLGRQGTGLNKFSIGGASPVTIVNQPDSVTQVGDALSAGNLNDLEDRIEDAFDDVDTALDTKADEQDVTNLNNAISKISDDVNRIAIFSSNLIDPSKGVAGYLSNGVVIENSGYRTTDYISVSAGKYVKKINTRDMGAGALSIALYNEGKTFLGNLEGTNLGSGWYMYTIPSTVSLIRLTTGGRTLSAPTCYFGLGETALSDIPKYGFSIGSDGTIDYSQVQNVPNYQEEIEISAEKIERIASFSSNLINPSERVVGYLNYDNGNVITDSFYSTTGYIRVREGNYVKFVYNATGVIGGNANKITMYDANKQFISSLAGSLITTDWYSYNIPANVAYIRLSAGGSSLTPQNSYFGQGQSVVSPIPEYGFTINADGKIDYSQITNAPASLLYDYKSPLTGKKWYALGDSATHGDGATTLTEGMYAGQLAVYPFYIGNRTGADVHNLAVNGGVIATITDQPSRYQLSKDGNYDAVPSDADIITIWLGANDMWQSVPIGTIDSNDATTFYGAWNKVLGYYVNNYPNTKLGIVASFWCTQAYAEAVIAIGAKYGVPVLNLYNDPKIPVTVGSQRPDVSETVKSTRNTQWIVGNGNTHPSSAYHEIESYFIEEWLKTL